MVGALAALGALGVTIGCATPTTEGEGSRRGESGADRAPTGTKPGADAPRAARERGAAVALIGDGSIDASTLHAALFEAAGALVLEEAALDAALDAELVGAGLSVTPDDVERERALLARAIDSEGPGGAAMIDRVRRSRGLGPTRFPALLARNAKLRRLVAPGVAVSDDDARREAAIDVGERLTARIIVCAAQRQASEIRERVAGAADVAAAFAREAMAHSTDESAARGGLLPRFHPASPGVPVALRRALEPLTPPALTPVIALDDGFAVAWLEAREAGREPTPADIDAARERARTRAERLAMERLARDLIARARVTPLDESLRWSWSAGRPSP